MAVAEGATYVFIGLLAACFYASGTGLLPAQQRVAPKTCDTRSQDYAKANAACLSLAGPLAQSKNGKLVLHLDSGKTKVFEDSNDDYDGIQLVGFQPATHIFVVANVLIDDTVWTVIDGRSGRVIPFKGNVRPFLSPDGKWIVAKRMDGSYGEGLSILDNAGPSLQKVWRSTAEALKGADFLVWQDDDRIVFPDVPGLTMVRSDGHWTLNEPSPSQSRMGNGTMRRP